MRQIDQLRERPVPATDKALGWLTRTGPVTAAGLAAARPAIRDFELPVMTLRESALAHNIEAMAAYCAAAGVAHAPHGKTTMAPQLIARQLAAGAWAVSAATAAQARVYRAFGVSRVLIASQLTQREAIEWLGRELAADPAFECYAYADSRAGVALLDEGLRAVRPGRRCRCWSSWATPAAGPAAGAWTRRWRWPPRWTRPRAWSWPARPGLRAAYSGPTWTRHWMRWPCLSPI